jgi:2-oxoglutarate dehydrogenase E1 component
MRKPSRANSNFAATNTDVSLISDKIHKEFNVLKLIDGYRSRGHLFTKTNPVKDVLHRQHLKFQILTFNCGFKYGFDAAKVINIQPCTLQEIITHLDTIYCQHIGVEYMYIHQKWLSGFRKN